MEWTNLNYVVHSSELASELVVDTKLKPCALLVHKGVTFSLSTTVITVWHQDLSQPVQASFANQRSSFIGVIWQLFFFVIVENPALIENNNDNEKVRLK